MFLPISGNGYGLFYAQEEHDKHRPHTAQTAWMKLSDRMQPKNMGYTSCDASVAGMIAVNVLIPQFPMTGSYEIEL